LILQGKGVFVALLAEKFLIGYIEGGMRKAIELSLSLYEFFNCSTTSTTVLERPLESTT
jgi:hypothetical protein